MGPGFGEEVGRVMVGALALTIAAVLVVGVLIGALVF